MDEEAPVKKKTVHEIGQDLSLLSVDELSERIEILEQEITRIEAARKTKPLAVKYAAENPSSFAPARAHG